MESLILGLLSLSFVGDIILHILLPYRRRKDNAEALRAQHEASRAQHDADRAEVERLHLMIDHQQKTLDKYLDIEKDNAGRIAELNKTVDDKTEQIRKLTEQMMASEHGRNADKDEIARLTKQNGDLRVEVEYYKMWRCEWPDCQDPRGRRPPNDKLRSLRFLPPHSQE